jgi:hypothetical protein
MSAVSATFLSKPLCSLLLGAVIALAAVGAVWGSTFRYTGKEFPALVMLQSESTSLMEGKAKLDEIVGKASAGPDSWVVYYIRTENNGEQHIDDDIVITKLDTDVCIMKTGSFMGSGVRWGIIQGE